MALRMHLHTGGPLWGVEMAEAAEVAAELGIPVVPLATAWAKHMG